MYKKLILFFFLSTITHCLIAQDTPPNITAIGDQGYCKNNSLNIVSSVSISDNDVSDTTLDLIRIQISEGYNNGSDILFLSGVHPQITSSWSNSEGILTLTGPATFVQFEDAIKEVLFSTTETNFTEDKFFSINIGNANYLPSTDHYYFYVADSGISWTEARDQAASQNFFGLQGYLATITTVEESQLSGEQSAGAGWIGATDVDTENTWKWVTGPEAGTVFWIGEANGSSQNGEYSFWNSSEPNNFGGNESYAHITAPNVGVRGSWNDLTLTGVEDPASDYHPKGYIVEFGGMPGDPSINLSASTSIKAPKIIEANDITFCENETISITVTSNTDTILWYDSVTATTPIYSGFTYTPLINTTTNYWVTPVFNGCSSGEKTQITVTINPQPIVFNITVNQCDTDTDQKTIVNLTSYQENISTNHISETFEYYNTEADAISGSNQIMNPTNILINTTYETWVKTISDKNCYNISKINLAVSYTPNEPYEDTFYACDDFLDADGNDTDANSALDGITYFDFSVAYSQISTNLNVDVEFYENEDDRTKSLNKIEDVANYRNTNIPNTTNTPFPIYYKLTSKTDNDCIGLGQIFLKVNTLPEFEVSSPLTLCLNELPLIIKAENPQDTYTYNWTNENGTILNSNTTGQLDVFETGTYTVTAFTTDGFSCSKSKNILVNEYDVITITEDAIEITDDSNGNPNSMSINITGDSTVLSEYEFALQSETGIFTRNFQDETLFQNLEGGIYTLIIRHKQFCTPNSELIISVVQFPKFFTPNNDNYNDNWVIKGINESFYPKSAIHVFNRFGILVAETTITEDGWDGTYNGKQLPPNDYWYKVTLTPPTNSNKKTIIKTGHFSLLRK